MIHSNLQEDKFTTREGGLLYAVAVNLSRRRVSVTFRGTVGKTDSTADVNYTLNTECFFSDKAGVFVDGNEPGTHTGFTKYLFHDRECEDERSYYDRIVACVSDQFEKNENVKGKNFQLYVTGHSLGGALANLFGFRVAQLKAMGHDSVKHLPSRVKVISFASPVVGNEGYNKEFQYLEKNGFLRHLRVSSEGDPVPTKCIYAPFKWLLKGDTSLYTQNGVNMFLHENTKMDIVYGNTKTMASQFKLTNPDTTPHLLAAMERRVEHEVNKECYEQTIEDIYKAAADYDK